MKLNGKQFLNLTPPFCSIDTSAVAILPVPYEGGTSYGKGTAEAPNSVIEASHFLELFDEELKAEPFRMGIVTVFPPELPEDPAEVQKAIHDCCRSLIQTGKYVVLLGGDHSISVGYFKALLENHERISVVQLDAHADLRDTYEGSLFSHACVMSRIRELTKNTLQIGIRSMSAKEAKRIEQEGLSVYTMTEYRKKDDEIKEVIEKLPDPVFVTLDVDVFDWSVIRSTGTPEPGGLLWDEGMDLLRYIFFHKSVIGFDVVELSHEENDRNSPFAVAKVIYKMLGFKLASYVSKNLPEWPEKSIGRIFN
jgi:agmatinase